MNKAASPWKQLFFVFTAVFRNLQDKVMYVQFCRNQLTMKNRRITGKKSHFTIMLISILFLISNMWMQGQKPVTPGSSPEARQLLEYIYSISGKQTLSGQHCAPLVGSTRLSVAHRNNGHYPAVFGQDFGFSYPGYWDGINYRQRIVDEAISRHEEGFIITIMWHAVPPNQDEPVSFRESIQSDLTEQEWKDLVTSGNPDERAMEVAGGRDCLVFKAVGLCKCTCALAALP